MFTSYSSHIVLSYPLLPPAPPQPVCAMTPRPLHVLAVVLVAAAVAARKYEILGQLESSAPDQVRQ